MQGTVPARGRGGSVTPRQSGDHWPPSPPQDPRPRLGATFGPGTITTPDRPYDPLA